MRVQEREPDPSLGGKCAREGIFEGEIPNSAYSVLLWAVDTLEMVKSDTLNQCMMKRASQFLPENGRKTTISLDGKTIRSAVDKKNMDSPLHIISAQICEIGVTLASEAVEDKSNEIPAVQELIKKWTLRAA